MLKLAGDLHDRRLEVQRDHSDEDGCDQRSEIDTNAAKGQSKVHALTEDGVVRVDVVRGQVLFQRVDELDDLIVQPTVEDFCTVGSARVSCDGCQVGRRVLVLREDRLVLGDDVEQVDASRLDRLGQVDVG